MAVLSVLRPLSKAVLSPLQRRLQLQGQVSVRNGGHGNTLPLVPSQFEFTRFKNDFHFYLLLGLVPMFTTITLVNIFVGPAELTDIPKEYEPKEWEYYQSPIKRWLVKYVYTEMQKEYEKTLHYLHVSRENRYWNQLESKVRHLQNYRQDYKGWYWQSVDKSLVDQVIEDDKRERRMHSART